MRHRDDVEPEKPEPIIIVPGDYVRIIGGGGEDRGRVFCVRAIEAAHLSGWIATTKAMDESGRKYDVSRLELVGRAKA